MLKQLRINSRNVKLDCSLLLPAPAVVVLRRISRHVADLIASLMTFLAVWSSYCYFY